MAGARTPSLAEAAVHGGADIIELGFPFSDPLAEGPVIREAAERALERRQRGEVAERPRVELDPALERLLVLGAVLARRMIPWTSYPFSSKRSAR